MGGGMSRHSTRGVGVADAMSRHSIRGVGVTDAMSRNAGAASEIQGQNIKDPVGKNLKNVSLMMKI